MAHMLNKKLAEKQGFCDDLWVIRGFSTPCYRANNEHPRHANHIWRDRAIETESMGGDG